MFVETRESNYAKGKETKNTNQNKIVNQQEQSTSKQQDITKGESQHGKRISADANTKS